MDENISGKDNDNSLDFVARHYHEGSFDPGKAWKKFRLNNQLKSATTYPVWIKIAATIAVLIISGSIWFNYENREISVRTSAGEIKEIYLPDNSLVKLSENSEILYNNRKFNREQRAVKMKGEIFFKVSHDESKTFSIETTTATIEVLGTSFNVSSNDQSTFVDVKTGKVSFESINSDRKYILTAGMNVTYDHTTSETYLANPANGITVSSRNDLLRFNHTPLEQVIVQLRSYYNTDIDYIPATEPLYLTATFEKMSLNEIAQIIEKTLDIKLEINNQR